MQQKQRSSYQKDEFGIVIEAAGFEKVFVPIVSKAVRLQH